MQGNTSEIRSLALHYITFHPKNKALSLLEDIKDSRSNVCSLVWTCNIFCIQWFPKLQISHVCIIWAKTVDVSYVMSMTTLGISKCLNWNIVPNVFDHHVCFLHLILPIFCTILCCQQPRIMLVLSQVYDILIAGVMHVCPYIYDTIITVIYWKHLFFCHASQSDQFMHYTTPCYAYLHIHVC